MSIPTRIPVPITLLAFLLLIFLSMVAGSSHAAQAGTGASDTPLTGPNRGAPLDIALDHLRKNSASLGLTSDDLADVTVTDQYVSQHNGVTHIYLRQRHQGIEVHGANININIASDGSVINLGNSFVPQLSKAIDATTPAISAVQAVNSAANRLGLVMKESLSVLDASPAGDALVISSGGISLEPIPVKLVYQPVADGDVRLSWSLEIYELDAQHYWSMRVDAGKGQVLAQDDFVVHDHWGHEGDALTGHGATQQQIESLLPDQYLVYAMPVESPNHTSPLPPADARTLETDPATSASPFGWHDTNGASGAEFTDTRGNNVDAYTDIDGNNIPDAGSRPDGGSSLSFTPSIDLSQQPSTYRDAAVTNLFYWNNLVHDVWYEYGFDEAGGNFQVNNYGNGGLGNDDVRAEAQDGEGNCNANFLTLADGSRPRMQMFTCNLASPARDGSLDNGVIVHEYAHGISNRLTGGPNNVSCLFNAEQAGEGWSDWLALMMTIESGDAGTDVRGMGTYLIGESASGNGIREFPYSTNMGVNPHTYNDIIGNSTHGRGSVWAAMIWEVSWALIDQYGFDPDFYHGAGGNNIAMQLIIDGMKLQSCSPGFVDARDGILLADQLNNAGANQCLLWEAFAKRGLGFSADQGSSGSTSDGTEAFDLPPACLEALVISKSASPSPVEAGTNLTYSLLIENNTSGPLTGVTATDELPAHTTYVPGSATCGGSESGGIFSFPIGAMNPGASAACSFEVTVDLTAASPLHLSDDMESGSGNWSVTGSGEGGWALTNASAHSPSNAWFAPDVARNGSHQLTLSAPVNINSETVLRFWHEYDTEATWDGGVVEISTNGGSAWIDLGPDMIANGYNSAINPIADSPLAGAAAFSGNSGGFIETIIDLGSFAGSNALIRFHFATDRGVSGDGWYVDDVEILDNGFLSNTACVIANEGNNACGTIFTAVTPGTVPTPSDINVTPPSITESVEPDQSSSRMVTIDNLGDLDLNWTIQEDDDANCASPGDDVPWLSESTTGETTGGGESDLVEVTLDASGLAIAVYNAALCISSNDPDESLVAVPVALTVETTPPQVTQLANGEIFVEGTVSGTYPLTHNDDGNAETLTEAPQTTGNPFRQRDSGEHIWTFPVQFGNNVNFLANSWISNVGDGDNFHFSYSTDSITYHPMFTLVSTDPDNTETALLSNVLPGDTIIYVKVEDSDFTQGNNNPDSLSIDYMHIVEGSGTGVNIPPTANFSWSASQLEVIFTDESNDLDDGIETWQWNFGDGNTSALASPIHTYAAPGTYTVALTVTDFAGESDSIIQSVSVNDSGPSSMTVSSLDPSFSSQGGSWTAFVLISVVDDLGGPVTGAQVTGTFSGGVITTASCVTDGSGSCTLENGGGVFNNVRSVDFTVDDVSGSLTYVPTLTTVTVFRR